jgi:hypothetical protein
LLDAALSVYEPAVGQRIHRERVLLYNAACAITFLANRVGTRPEDRSCGRTLDQDLRWSSFAIAKVLGSETLPYDETFSRRQSAVIRADSGTNARVEQGRRGACSPDRHCSV